VPPKGKPKGSDGICVNRDVEGRREGARTSVTHGKQPQNASSMCSSIHKDGSALGAGAKRRSESHD